MNPGPSSSSNTNQVMLSASFDSSNRIQSFFGNSATPISPIDFARATQSPTANVFSTLPSGVAPSGSVAANGALTLGTALDGIYGPTGISVGIYLYFPFGAVFAGSPAGSYWCVMTSTTLGTIYNNVYTPPGLAPIPTTLVPVVAAGPGSYTGVTTEVAVGGIILPGNSMGALGGTRKISFWSCNNNANAKTFRVRFGGISGTAYENVNTANNLIASAMTLIWNRGTGFQTGPSPIAFGLSTSAIVTSAVDTTQDVSVLNTAQLATATDFLIVQAIQCEVFAR